MIALFCVVSDVDECSEGRSNCSQLCVNVDGSYKCNCSSGYSLHSNGKDCDGEYHICLIHILRESRHPLYPLCIHSIIVLGWFQISMSVRRTSVDVISDA